MFTVMPSIQKLFRSRLTSFVGGSVGAGGAATGTQFPLDHSHGASGPLSGQSFLPLFTHTS